MGYEVDFLPVGDGDSSGDAIAVRWGVPGSYQVLIYDGGTRAAGEALVQHVRMNYGTTQVAHVVSSHPDCDHASGLAVVLEQLDVQQVWMHRPWAHSPVINGYFADGRITEASLAARLQNKMRAAYELERLALRRGIPITEPYQGQAIGPFWVLSPHRDWYIHDLIPAFEKSPDVKAGLGLRRVPVGVSGALALATRAGQWLAEHWNLEYLRENVCTSAENESSVVLYGDIDGEGVLLTGDAGVRALSCAASCAELNRLDLPNRLALVQIPHHGSRHNVSPSTLDRAIGPRNSFTGASAGRFAIASAGKGSQSHPRRMVMNAFLRRGFQPYATRGTALCFGRNMPPRQGWHDAVPTEFSTSVEAWD